ncbi:MAG: glycosyltransferase family 4 protein [Candidatus Latescibacteria bacterium]|nr:glycosyltransferase family 4 protein [Candidatus Latescibacterota bacterium]
MNIVIFNWQDIRNPLSGGAEVHIHQIFSRIATMGHRVTLFCSSFQGAKARETIDGIEVIRKGWRSLFNFWVPIAYLTRFRKRYVDIVIDDINKIPFFTPLYIGTPLVGIGHHLFGKNIFLEVNFLPALYVYLGEWLIQYVYRKTPFIVYSESTYHELIELGFPEKNLAMVYNGVNHDLYHPTGIPKSETPLIGYLGRLKRYKSVDHLIKAFYLVKHDIPEAKLMILGDGDARPELERLSTELGVGDSTEFTGYVSEEDKAKYLQQMHLVVNTSSKEGWGLTVIEANACGTCVIASDVPGLRDSVVDGKTGLLYEYGNIRQLAGKMRDLLQDNDLRERLSQHAIAWAQRFDWDTSARKVVDVLKRTIEQHRRAL